jgi:hypothetical protein
MLGTEESVEACAWHFVATAPLISTAKDTAVVCVAFGATLLGTNMNTARSIRWGTNSPGVSINQLLMGIALITGCSGKLDTSTDGSVQSAGGSRAASGGSASTTGGSGFASGGASSVSSLDICASDSDCMTCQWSTAPADSTQCSSGWYCCYGVPLTQARCSSNQAAWTTNCPTANHLPCPCAYEVCSVACVNGQCTGSCGIPMN